MGRDRLAQSPHDSDMGPILSTIKSLLEVPCRVLHSPMFLLLVLALGVRALFLVVVAPDPLKWPDSRHYDRIAWRLARGQSYDAIGESPPAAYRPPLLPVFMAAVYALCGHNVLAVQYALALVTAMVAPIVFSCTRRLAHRRTALIAGVAAALYPQHVYLCGAFYPEAIGVVLIALISWSALALAQAPTASYRLTGLLGALCGLAALCRPNWLLAMPAAISIVLWKLHRTSAAIRRSGLLLALLTWAVTWTPWTIRNYFVHNKLILISANGGRNLYLGNHPSARWNSTTAVPIPDTVRRRELALLDAPGELDSYFRQLAWSHIASNPLRSLSLYIGKFIHYWQPFFFTKSNPTPFYYNAVAALTYTPVLLCTVLAVLTSCRSTRRYLSLLLLLPLLDAMTVSFFITPIRLRLPFDHLLIIVTAVYLYRRAHRSAAESLEAAAVHMPHIENEVR